MLRVFGGVHVLSGLCVAGHLLSRLWCVLVPSNAFVGQLVKVRWYYANQALQGFQQQAFQNGGPLPPGYGIDPSAVYLDVEYPNAGTVSYTVQYPGTITKETTGVYHFNVDTSYGGGKWWWRAYSTGTGQTAYEDYILVSQNLPGPAE